MIFSLLMQRFIAIVLCACLSLQSLPAQSKPAAVSIKEKLLLIPAGALVEMKLADKRKLRGRMGAVAEDGVSIQYVRNDKVVDEKIAFQDVRSVKAKDQGMSTGLKVGLGIAAGVGITFAVLLILALTLGD